MEVQQSPFIKELAANDRPTRDAALLSLRTYLSGRRSLPPIELLKLWKGLFYCLWMSDRALTQQALCNSLAELVSIVPDENTIPFLRAFWQTMQREWTNIDVLRMEKFFLLVRRYLGASFRWVKEGGKVRWDAERTRTMAQLLEEVPCNVKDVRVPNGLRYHVIDIFVDELERVGALEQEEGEGDEEAEVPLEELLRPLRGLAEGSPTKTVRLKAKEVFEDERLPRKGHSSIDIVEAKGEEQTIDTYEEDEEWAGIED